MGQTGHRFYAKEWGINLIKSRTFIQYNNLKTNQEVGKMGIDLPHCSLTHFNPTNISEAPTQCWVVPAAEWELKLWDVVLQQPLDTGQAEPRKLWKVLLAGRRKRLSSRKKGIGRFVVPRGETPKPGSQAYNM